MIRAPSETRCSAMPIIDMTVNVIARTIGMATATTKPARSPSARKPTAITIAMASNKARVKPPIAVVTTCDWSETACRSSPIGSSAWIAATSRRSAAPSRRMSPSSAIDAAMPIAGMPL